MQLTVKTLKGEKFVVDANASNTVAEVKTIIENQKAELPAANMKLIHSGKVLKDEDTIESCNIKPNAFLVVMISKAKKATPAPAPTPTPAPAAASTTETPSNATPTPSTTTATDNDDATPPTANTSSSTSTSQPATTATATTEPTPITSTTTATTSSSSTPAAPAPTTDSFPPELVTNLTAMGFPEAEVRACLRASQGNPDIAVEYLMNGIPAYAQQIANASNSAAPTTMTSTSNSTSQQNSTTSSTTSTEPLAALRNHPQINQLRQLVQSNPSTLQAVLTQIGQQQPDLLQEINSNQELFLQIMNEPTTSGTGTGSTNTTTAPSPVAPSAPSSGLGAGNAAALLEGMNNPAQMAQMIQSMTPEQLQAMAGMMGMPAEQLTAMAQLIGQMPPEDFEQHMNMALQQGAGGLGDFMGGGGGGSMGGAPPGAQVVRLTEEEMAAVDRLTDMGFDRTEAAQAYLACDKNEALAANLLMDGGWGDMDMGGGGNGDDGNDNDDDMYD